MSRSLLIFALGLILLAFGGSSRPIAADPPEKAKKAKPITLDEIEERGIEGQLGKPMGTVVSVEGEFFDGDKLRLKYYSGKILLHVDKVDGKEISAETKFLYHIPAEELDELSLEEREEREKQPQPKIGSRFKFRGYETAGFAGRPKDVTVAFATQSYHFSNKFVIISDLNKKKQK